MGNTSTVEHYGGPRRLRVGDVVQHEGEKIVVRVSDSCASLSNVRKRSIQFTDGASGKTVSFDSVGSGLIHISAHSEIPILRRTGEDGLAYWKRHKELP